MARVDVVRRVGEGLVAARPDIAAAEGAGGGAAGGAGAGGAADGVAALGAVLVAVAPEIAGLRPGPAMARVGAALSGRQAGAFAALLAAVLTDAGASVREPDLPLAAARSVAYALEHAARRRVPDTPDARRLADALVEVVDALDAASDAEVSLVEGLSLAMLAAYEHVDTTGGLPPAPGARRRRVGSASMDPVAIAVAAAVAALAHAVGDEP